MKTKTIKYERVFNLGNYESVRLTIESEIDPTNNDKTIEENFKELSRKVKSSFKEILKKDD